MELVRPFPTQHSHTGLARRSVHLRRSSHASRPPPRGRRGALVESYTGEIALDGNWDYDRFLRQEGRQDEKLHLNVNAALRGDCLFSYQPNPGTVFFAGYSSLRTEPEALRFDGLRRTTDGFFVKASYLFRM